MFKDSGDSDKDLIDRTIRSTGAGPSKIKVPKSEGISQEHILRAVRKTYRQETDKDLPDRIMNSIDYLAETYPDQPVPINLIYWMCLGGRSLKPLGTDEMKRFQRQISATRKRMITRKEGARSFVLADGTVRALTTREQHATEKTALPAFKKRVISAIQQFDAMAQIVGDADKLQLPAAQKEDTRQILLASKNLTHNIAGLLVAPTGKPKKK